MPLVGHGLAFFSRKRRNSSTVSQRKKVFFLTETVALILKMSSGTSFLIISFLGMQLKYGKLERWQATREMIIQ